MEGNEKDIFLGCLACTKDNSRAEGVHVLKEQQNKCSANVNKSQIKLVVPQGYIFSYMTVLSMPSVK